MTPPRHRRTTTATRQGEDASPNPFTLAGRSVVVTGASRGLGRAMALAAGDAGATVFGVARDQAALDATAKEATSTFHSICWDLTDLDAIERLCDVIYERSSTIDGVVHAAGIQRRGPAIGISVADWRDVLRLHLDVPFFLSTAIGRRQQEQGCRGSHVFIGSLGSYLGLPLMAPYVAAKSGVLGVVRLLAVEWAQSGIRVNAIAPGYFRTDQTADLLSDAERQSWILSRVPMGRLGIPADLGGSVVYLLSDASRYQTGTTVVVDGGWLAS